MEVFGINVAWQLIVAAVVGSSVGFLFGLTRGRTHNPVWETVDQEEQRTSYVARIWVAGALVLGFFAVVFTLFSGAVDLAEPSVAGFAGFIFGHVAGKIDPVLENLFGSKPTAASKDDDKTG